MMKTAVVVGLIAAMAAPAFAQNQQDPSGFMVEMLRRVLNLDESQTTKAREIFKKQSDDLRGILTDEQKQRYDQMSQGFGGGRGGFGGGAFGGGGRGGPGGGFFPGTDELKTQLSLTDDQATKINEIRDGTRQQMRDFWQNRQGGGNPGEEFQAFMTKIREESTKKVRDVLTDEQKPKFDEIVKTYTANQPQVQFGGPGGGRGGRGGTVEERVARAMEALKVANPAEAEAIRGLVKKVVELMEKSDTQEREARGKIDETRRNADLSDEAVGDRLTEIRKGGAEIDKELASARKELSEVVTNRQELELLRLGILR
jgi:hypothetical protein